MSTTTVPRLTVAIPTPFTAGNAVDTDGIERICGWLTSEQNVGSIIPAGTTGEFPALTGAERIKVLYLHCIVNGCFTVIFW